MADPQQTSMTLWLKMRHLEISIADMNTKMDRILENGTKLLEKSMSDETVVKKKPRRRLMWAIFITVIFLGLCYELYAVINHFVNTPTATEVETAPMSSLDFPTMLICSVDPYDQRKLASLPYPNWLAAFSHVYYYGVGARAIYWAEAGTELLDQVTDLARTMPNEDLRHLFLKAGHDCESFLSHCWFGWVRFNCCERFSPILDSHFGVCFELNSSGLVQRFPNMGLQVNVNILNVNNSEDTSFSGLAVKIQKVLDLGSFDFDFLSLGSYHVIKLAETEYININPIGARKCLDSSLDDWYVQNGPEYSKELCTSLIFAIQGLVTCKCLTTITPKMMGVPLNLMTRVCFPNETLNCLHPRVQNNASMEHFLSHNCMPKCHRTHYTPVMSSLDLPNQIVGDYKTTKLNVYFDKMQSTLIKEVPILTFDTLVSQIGGLVGIFLGGSLLTGLELVINFGYKLTRRFRNKKTPVVAV